MQECKILSNIRNKKNCFQESFTLADSKSMLRQILTIICLSLLIVVIPSLGQNPGTNPTNNITSIPMNDTTLVPLNSTSLDLLSNTTTSQLNEVNLNTTIPEALIVLPEQILPETVVISMAAIYNNTSAIFVINNTNIIGGTITIEIFSVDTGGNHTDYTIQPAQVILNNLSVGKYQLDIKDRLTGLSLYNSSFYIRPFGQLFQENGIIGNLQTYKGGLVNDTMYLVPSPLNPVCAPGLFNYTHTWANSTDQFFLGFNLSNAGNDTQQINLTIQSENEGLSVSPSYSLVKSLSKNSSLLMPFEVESTDLIPGIYNLTYNLTYAESSLNRTLNGELHIGIYLMNVSFGANETINTKFISPFNDRINQSAQDWNSYPISENASISFPGKVFHNATYGNFTLQEPNSPWLHVLVGAAVGSVIGSGSELAH